MSVVPFGTVDPQDAMRNSVSPVGQPPLAVAIAAYLKTRDEMLSLGEADDVERLASALEIVGLLNADVRARVVGAPPVIDADDGYANAFYEISDMLGIGAQARSPKEVWETQMRPALRELVSAEARIADLEAKLVEALEWYAEKVGSCRKNSSEGNDARAALDADCGDRALAALAATAQRAAS